MVLTSKLKYFSSSTCRKFLNLYGSFFVIHKIKKHVFVGADLCQWIVKVILDYDCQKL